MLRSDRDQIGARAFGAGAMRAQGSQKNEGCIVFRIPGCIPSLAGILSAQSRRLAAKAARGASSFPCSIAAARRNVSGSSRAFEQRQPISTSPHQTAPVWFTIDADRLALLEGTDLIAHVTRPRNRGMEARRAASTLAARRGSDRTGFPPSDGMHPGIEYMRPCFLTILRSASPRRTRAA